MAASRATVGGPISMVASFVAVVSHRSAMSIPHKSARSHPFCGWYWIRSSKEGEPLFGGAVIYGAMDGRCEQLV